MTVSVAERHLAGGGFIDWLRPVAERHPEWWTIGLAGMAWMFLIAHELSGASVNAFCPPRGGWFALDWTSCGYFIAMTAAMMLPLTVIAVRRTAIGSLWHRRHRAIIGFIVGYLGTWTIVTGIGVALAGLLAGWSWAPVVGFAVAAAWEASLLKRVRLSVCHATLPLRPRGWRADWDCVRYGMLQGRACATSCWAIMLTPLLVGAWQLPIMAFATFLCGFGRYWPRRRQHLEMVALTAAALGYAALILA
ncbi:MAG TPA: DUF2182 domain-containing protein [Stellaceae bacterium]|nr:DUF2182 domain-containing protein [Stellaceae bacterium]